jgi:isoaspartyl peptidase/L-asparaginase-like protein (Ntn-hydrolase superfamily)
MQVIVHGGAGSTPEHPDERQASLDAAARAGADAADPVSAVRTAIREMEAAPYLNAGRDGAIQSDGVPRTDAGIMTDDRSVGAACSMTGVQHAIEVAEVVRTETPHVLIAGEHAVRLAAQFDIETDVDLTTERTRTRWEEADPPEDPADQLPWVRDRFGGHDTVGAVATDGERIVAGTSTGGRWFALAGRVGDVPQVGCGFYASPAGGASATGAGEDIARTTLSRRAVELLEDGFAAPAAAETAIDEFGDLVEGTAGVIVADAEGETGSAYDSESMQTATLHVR